MARAAQKITLSPSLGIPFDRLQLSQSNVRRTLFQSLNVRPLLDAAGQATGSFEIPASGRRFRALATLGSFRIAA